MWSASQYFNGSGFGSRAIDAGYRYRLRGWYKTYGDGTAGVYIGSELYLGTAVLDLPAASDWTAFDISFSIADGETVNRYLQFLTSNGSLYLDGLQLDRAPFYVAPDPRVEFDIGKSAEVSRWFNSYDPNMLTVNTADGTISAPACGWDRDYRLRIGCSKYTRLAVPDINVVEPDDEQPWAYA